MKVVLVNCALIAILPKNFQEINNFIFCWTKQHVEKQVVQLPGPWYLDFTKMLNAQPSIAIENLEFKAQCVDGV